MGQGWVVAGSVVSGKAGIFSSTARLPMPPSMSPAGGAPPGPLGVHNPPFCSLPFPEDFSHPLLVHFLF